MLRLITAPIRLGLTVTGRALGAVRSAIPGQAPGQASGGPVEPPTARDTSASEWDEEAPVPPGGSDPDDLIVLDRVKTEIFRPGDAEKGSVNVSVENGVVYLRGDVEDPAQAEYFEVAAADVEGVVRVENLIGTSSS